MLQTLRDNPLCVCLCAYVHRDPVVQTAYCLVRACGRFSRGETYNRFPASIGVKNAWDSAVPKCAHGMEVN